MLAISGVWIGTSPWMALAWAGVVGLAYFTRPVAWRPAGEGPAWGLSALAALPCAVYLAATWQQEFPQNGDQFLHNGLGLEAFAFWWPWPWILTVGAIVVVARWLNPRATVAAIALLPVAGALIGGPYSFAGRYPGTLHFFAAPLHALANVHPLNVERTLNALAIPAWLLVLRPSFVRRRPTAGTYAIAALLFWQKDVVYYFTSGYLEPWAIVLVLTALEHLIVFDGEAVWEPLLLLGTAAMVKEHTAIALPVVALVYFPRRERLQHILLTLTALAPFALFACLRTAFRTWSGVAPLITTWPAARLATYGRNILEQFGTALPVVLAGVIALAALAKRRPFAAILLVALADAVFFFTAPIQQPWTGYPRTNLVPLVCAALAVGALIDRLPRRAAIISVALVLGCNLVPLLPSMRAAFGPDTERNFVEHDDAPVFYPVREALTRAEREGLIRPGGEVRIVNNGKRLFELFYPGPIGEQYPDFARRYRIRVTSFRNDVTRCGCTPQGAAPLAVFIAFHNLGVNIPQRAAIEDESARCRAVMAATCNRVLSLDHAAIGR